MGKQPQRIGQPSHEEGIQFFFAEYLLLKKKMHCLFPWVLLVTPRHGQWLGLFPEHPNIGRTFRSGFRSERKALLQVILGLWKYHQGTETPTEFMEFLSDEIAICDY